MEADPDAPGQRKPPQPGRLARAQVSATANGTLLVRRRQRRSPGLRAAFGLTTAAATKNPARPAPGHAPRARASLARRARGIRTRRQAAGAARCLLRRGPGVRCFSRPYGARLRLSPYK